MGERLDRLIARLIAAVAALILLTFAIPALAQTSTVTSSVALGVPVNPDEAIGLFVELLRAAQAGEWLWVVAGALMMLVWITRTFVIKSIPKKQLIYWAVGLGVAVAVASSLAESAMTQVIWWVAVLKAIGLGISAGFAAGGAWSFGGRKVLPQAKTPGEE